LVDPNCRGWLLDDNAGWILSSLVLCRLLRLLTSATLRRTDLGRGQCILNLLHRVEMLTQGRKRLLRELLELLIVPVLGVLIFPRLRGHRVSSLGSQLVRV
jgi:hypothetical protein